MKINWLKRNTSLKDFKNSSTSSNKTNRFVICIQFTMESTADEYGFIGKKSKSKSYISKVP